MSASKKEVKIDEKALLDMLQIVFFDKDGTSYELVEADGLKICDSDGELVSWLAISNMYRIGIRSRTYIYSDFYYYPFSLKTKEEVCNAFILALRRAKIAKKGKESISKHFNFFLFVSKKTEQAFYETWEFKSSQTDMYRLSYTLNKRMTTRLIEEERTILFSIRHLPTKEEIATICYSSSRNIYYDKIIAECMQAYLYYTEEELLSLYTELLIYLLHDKKEEASAKANDTFAYQKMFEGKKRSFPQQKEVSIDVF